MDTIPQNPKRKQNKCPEMCGTRPEKDVQLLLERAKDNGFGRSWSDILNTCARIALTERFANKQIRNIQDKLGVAQ